MCPVSQEPTSTTSVGGLLERSAQLDALAEHLAAVRAHGRGRLVLIAGEAGIGKTTLVRAFCDGARSIRVALGRLRRAVHAAPARPVRRHRRTSSAASSRRVVAAGATPAASSPRSRGELRRGAPTLVVLEDLHWADEATLDVVRLLARRIEPVPALVVGRPTATTSSTARIRCGSCSASCPRSDATTAARSRRCRPTRSPRSPGRRASIPARCIAARPATRSSSPRCSRPAARAMPDTRPRRRAGARRAPGRRARALLDAVAIVPQRAELWLLEALADGDLATLDALPRVGHAASRAATPSRSATRSRGSRSRRRSRRTGALALHRRALAALIAHAARQPEPARLAHHAEAAGRRRCGAALRARPPASRRPRWARTARRRRSSRARCASANGLAQRAARRAARAPLLRVLPDRCDARGDRRSRRRMERAPRRRRPPAGGRRAPLALAPAWFAGDNATAEAEARAAVELLEALAPGPRARHGLQQHGAAADARRQRHAGATQLGTAGDRARRAPGRDARSSCTR